MILCTEMKVTPELREKVPLRGLFGIYRTATPDSEVSLDAARHFWSHLLQCFGIVCPQDLCRYPEQKRLGGVRLGEYGAMQ
jgi:hypothetical protein